MTSTESASFTLCVSELLPSPTAYRCSSMLHVPTAKKWLRSWSSPMGVMSMHATSSPNCSVLHSCRDPSDTDSREMLPPPLETATWVGLPVATLMAPPELGFHSDTRWREWQSMRRTPDAVTWMSWSLAMLAHHSVCMLASKPGSSASSSSSSWLMAKSRVSPTKDSTRYLSCTSMDVCLKLHTPLMPSSSMVACSLMPMPFRTILRDPSDRAPLHVTTWPCPCRSRSTTQKSIMGPKFVYVSSSST
mmetsp:Transcript_14305/g.38801  ORF Transcript_14305/g.38801 Transcript_14305/m.38801 type:complete len:247 (-) Transcript_14305:122-862(-)